MPATDLPAPLETALATGDPEEILTATMRHFDTQAGTVHLLRAGLLELVAHRGLPEPVVQIVARVPIGKGMAGLAAERREPVTICNLQTDNSGQARPAARSTGMAGSVAVPMLSAGELCGVLGIARSAACDWAPPRKQTSCSRSAIAWPPACRPRENWWTVWESNLQPSD